MPLLADAIGPFLRVTDLGGRDPRGTYWRFLALGALPAGMVLGLAGWGVGALAVPAPVTITLAVLVGLLALWWLVALVTASLRRLRDAHADLALAFSWPLLPVVAASGATIVPLLAVFGLVPSAWVGAGAVVGAIVFALVLLTVTLVACATRTSGGRASRPVLLITCLVLMPVVTGVALLVVRILRSVLRPNLGTALGMLASVVALLFIAGQAPDRLEAGARAWLAVGVGVVFAGLHVLRWALQTRHFGSARILVRYAGGRSSTPRDPRYIPWLFHSFKVLGLLWIVVATIAATRPITPLTFGFILGGFGAYTGYLALPALLGLVLVALPTTSAADDALRLVAFPLLAVFIAVATLFAFLWLRATPTDNRYNVTSAFRRYARESEW